MADMAQRLAQLTPAQRQLLEARLKQTPNVAQPIAIIGMSCRLPGAPDLAAFWRLACEQRHAFQEVPADRWDVDAYYDPDPETPGKMATRCCAFVDHVADFDAVFFGIAPREATRMDPQQRLLLEVSWEALEHAGIAPQSIAGSPVGVFVGIGGTDYSKVPSYFDNYHELIDAHVGTGNALSIASNRISYILDLRGPSMSVDTACSSGMLGVHLAVQSLRNEDCDLALAGGVNLILSPETTIAFSKARMLSSSGVCRPFDSRADGYVRGEGCAMLVLKRLTDAARDGDHVLAVIRGSAANQDGRTSGITAPNSLSQQACIRAALASAGLDPSAVSYIEAHGTGTPLGDPIEIQSLSRIFRTNGQGDPPCYVASVKANIGHTETVSGVAGIVKTVLMMQHGIIPAQAGLQQINENIQLDGTRLQFPRENLVWDTGARPRVAGVSSFGFGGTNTHVILEAATPTRRRESQIAERPQQILAFSAKAKGTIPLLAERLGAALERLTDAQLADFCFSANTGRSHFNHRCAVISSSREQLLQQLRGLAAEEKVSGTKRGEVRLATRPKVAFLFTGQGSQFPSMGRRLYELHPRFRAAIDQCTEILRSERPLLLTDILFNPQHAERIHETQYTQPALFALEYALAELWQAWGVEPSYLLGHSVGEYVAACVASVFSLEDGLKLIAKRAQLMQEMPPNGTMAVIFAGRERVAEAIQGFAGRVTIATANGPENNGISGDTAAVDEIVARFERTGVGTQRLNVSHAFHSPLMDPMLDAFESFAATLKYDRPKIPIVANRSGTIVDSAAFDAAYWRDHLRNAVEFAQGMECLAQQGIDALLELGPAPQLLGMGKRCADFKDAAWIPSLRKGRDDWDVMVSALADLYTLGVPVNWQGWDAPWSRNRITLPSYPFKRTHYWMEGNRSRFGGAKGTPIHPLLGSLVLNAFPSKLLEMRISGESPKYLRDHVVQGSMVVPAAVYVEQGLALAHLQFGEGCHAVEDLAIQRGLFLPAEGYRVMQVTLAPEAGGRAVYDTYSASPECDEGPEVPWIHHVSACIVHGQGLPSETPAPPVDVDAFRSQKLLRSESKESFYGVLRRSNLTYGPSFQVVGYCDRTDHEALGSLEIPESIRPELDKYHLHPTILDAMFQIAAGVVPLDSDGDYSRFTYVPIRMRHLRRHGSPALGTHVFARRLGGDSSPNPDTVEADLYLIAADGKVLVECRGLTLLRAGQPAQPAQQDVHDWLYKVAWQPLPLPPSESDPPLTSEHILVLADPQGVADSLAEQICQAGGSVSLVDPGPSFSVHDGRLAMRPGTSDDFADLWSSLAPSKGPVTQICHLWSLGMPQATGMNPDGFSIARERTLTSTMFLLQHLARSAGKPPKVWLVTQQAQSVASDHEPVAVLQAPLWGFGRVAALEHPELAIRLVDLASDQTAEAAAGAILRELAGASEENQIAWRGETRWVARLQAARDQRPATRGGHQMVLPEGDYRLRITTPGSFDQLRFEPHKVAEPAAGQVTIHVQATGLNFSDVLKALGLYPGIRDAIVPLGIECSGIVTAVGPGVTRFQIGDEVMGIAPYSFASTAVTAEYALTHKPKSIDFEEAATIPIVFLTAYYALVRLAQLQPGERLLVHAGAGGVGLAAIQIAQHLGAEVFATAGSDEKRKFLQQLGVPHVYNSRTTAFADEILNDTKREGVDVVLNSLPGEAIAKSLSILRAYGRFLEIGKTDIYANTMVGLLPFQDNLSYFAIDLDRMLRQRPEAIRQLFSDLMEHFAAGHFRPVPFTQFPAEDTAAAFRFMAQRKNTGKIVVSMARPGQAASDEMSRFHHGSYLITGGAGALGLRVAHWLQEKGVQHMALLSRRTPSGGASEQIARLRERGTKVVTLQGDVASRESLQAALAALPREFPPIRGVFHAAGALADGVILNMSASQLNVPLEAKVDGSWNLHEWFLDRPLELFVGFSSVASVLGSPGQANYAAGNAFLDALAAYRRAEGLFGLSVNWGPWADSGMAAEAGRDRPLADRGMALLPPDKALEALDLLIAQDAVQASVMSVHWGNLLAASSRSAPPFLREVTAGIALSGADSAEDVALRQSLRAMSPTDRQKALVDYFMGQLASITGLEAADIDPVRPLNTMGLDSLMAIELKNKAEKRLQITIPMSAFIHEPSVSSLARHAADAFEGSSDAVADVAQDASQGSSAKTHGGTAGGPPRPPNYKRTQNLEADRVGGS